MKLRVYWDDSPTVIEDSEKVKTGSVNDRLNFILNRLKEVKYNTFPKDDPMLGPDVMFIIGQGDCEDRVAYAASMLKKWHIPHFVYIGQVIEDNKPIEHIWIVVGNDVFETTTPQIVPKSTVENKYKPQLGWYCDEGGVIHGL